MKRFEPVSSQPPSDRSALQRSEAASDPLDASDNAYAPSHSPANRRGRYLRFSSSDPNAWTPNAERWWTESARANEKNPRATSSSTAR